MIILKDLCKTYKTKHSQLIHAVKDINLHVKAGEIYGVLGKSGAGKSTLLRCANLLERPTSGKVIIDQVDLTALSFNQLRAERRKISMIFQHFNLLSSRTAFDNIALPLELDHRLSKAEIRQRVSELLDLVHLTERQDHYPDQLSGGQKQRVAIARALATNPKVLLCDEATSALDPDSTNSILSLLKEINQNLGLTILLITHELDVVKKICDHVGILDHGELVEQDTVINIFTASKSPVTKKLLAHENLSLDLPSSIKDKLPPPEPGQRSLIALLTFIGQDSEHPILSTLIKKFKIDVNILQANIEMIQELPVGSSVCQLNGASVDIENALNYLNSLAIKIEVLEL